MTHASLFSGIGGFDYASELMRWENLFTCEKDKFCQQILKYYWPNATHYGDIKETDFSIWRGKIDVLTGGFPCQPFSDAGKKKGTEDDRYLWPEMLKAIRAIKPRWIVGENVRGLVNWSKGLVFEQVQVDLEIEGYEVLPLLLPACSVNAPHQRYRIWFIAYAGGDGHMYKSSKNGSSTKKSEGEEIKREWIWSDIERVNVQEPTTNAKCKRLQGNKWMEESIFITDDHTSYNGGAGWNDFPTVSPVCNGNDGLSYGLDAIAFSKWRRESIKGGGNAVVPPLVLQIFKTIEAYELRNRSTEEGEKTH